MALSLRDAYVGLYLKLFKNIYIQAPSRRTHVC